VTLVTPAGTFHVPEAANLSVALFEAAPILYQLVPSVWNVYVPQLAERTRFAARPWMLSEALGAIVRLFVPKLPVLSKIYTVLPASPDGLGKVIVNAPPEVLA
jgi:hypothetical protein